MNVWATVQSKLDKVLLPYGILSHHNRRVKVDKIADSDIKVNNDEYVVYRLVSSGGRTHGDGKARLVRYYIDVNYYYSYEKTDAAFGGVVEHLAAIKAEFAADNRFFVANDTSDISDIDNPYRGINIEFLFVGVVDNGG